MTARYTLHPGSHCHPPRSAKRFGFLRSIGFVIGSLSEDFSSTNEPNHRSRGMKREKAISTLQVDDGKVRVTRWDFSPGAETGWHTHGMDYVVVPLTDGTLSAELLDGSTLKISLPSEAHTPEAPGLNITLSMPAVLPSASSKWNSSDQQKSVSLHRQEFVLFPMPQIPDEANHPDSNPTGRISLLSE